ncbi:NFX1-type zinc finger-containing protein 1-like [Zerene cesonia]|uniref:NFX1-type zinc finger-containing protein 1-like n=1 Tax=Zerene cesonia TaxID=33412 RepID=UPI0018E55EFE|nr:NFX1-type zinc finger-containing protein 1-like [Zerene cesonia]
MSAYGYPGPGPSNNGRPDFRNHRGFNRRMDRGRGGSQQRRNRNINEEHVNENESMIFNQSNKRRNQNLGILTLMKLSEYDGNDILSEINSKREAFCNFLKMPSDRLDVYSLILSISAKICQSRFDQLKLELLLEICNSGFIQNLVLYLLNLPYTENKEQNSLYWKHQTTFWKNLILTLECIIAISPSTATNKCRSLIESASKCCLEALKEKHNYELPEEDVKKFQILRNFFSYREKTTEEEKSHSASPVVVLDGPPNSFRELSVLPTTEDLLDSKPFVRPNIVDGAYNGVDHYLDVQFRLLREDCYGPLREGIMQFRHDPTRRRYENIRVFRKAKFAEPYVSSVAFGHIIQLDSQTTKRFRNIKWKYNKRFLYGALLLFTKDDCKSFIVATVLDRESSYLCKGKIPVSIIDDSGSPNDKAVEYTMIESDIYFEPYYGVLKVLKDPTFPEHLAMKKYIVDVEASSSLPLYLRDLKQRSPDTYTSFLSSAEEMCLNESQYEAFKLALTHEFAVIQGPPGTGKTYLGVKVAESLLKLKRTENNCFLLIICYTNHALDQFLDAILRITPSVVRIGGQSRMESMKKLNLNERRKLAPKSKELNLYYDKKRILKSSVSKLNQLQNLISAADNGILDIKVLKQQANIRNTVNKIETHFKTLRAWLFDSKLISYDYSQPITIDVTKLNCLENNNDNDGDINLRDVNVIFDDLNIVSENLENICEFSLNTIKKDLIKSMKKYQSKPCFADKINIINHQVWIETFEDMKSTYLSQVRNGDLQNLNPLRMSLQNRWMLYFQWVSNFKQNWLQKVKPIQEEAITANAAYEESRILLDLTLIRDYKIIGMTTSGAARMRKLIQEAAPQIVIVEEAAEVLEQHIVASLQQNCQHVILIGDHKQLRPSASHMKLARHYNIEVSLFERMIKNKIHSRTLSVQHRMRPEIAALISPHIYPDLKNHSSVECFPNVRGLVHNLFFFTHEHPEQKSEDSTSKFNEAEANMVLGLANYIMQQRYEPEDVTILAAYTAQMFYMNKNRNNYAFLSKVKITVVDNYQGEESKIIILSLVRNNAENRIGFLGTENRICVALSRAREGLYIFGNMSMLKNQSDLWKKINGTLDKASAIGTTLELRCESHPDNITQIESHTDFEKVPEGGCMLKCNSNLPCSHACKLICHAYDRNHEQIQCTENCERILCDLQHVCPLRCTQECKPCNVEIEKTFPCGHTNTVPCHINPNTDKVLCHKIVTVTLPSCGHEVRAFLYNTRRLSRLRPHIKISVLHQGSI